MNLPRGTDGTTDTGVVPEPVADELRILEHVRHIISARPRDRRPADYRAQYIKLRDSLSEERLPEDRASILEQLHRISRLAAHQAKREKEVVNPKSPYFGHMRLATERNKAHRDILVGKSTYIVEGVTIVDWRNAPISRVFYQCSEGDDYELRIDERDVCGKVLNRRIVTIDQGDLLRVGTPTETYVRQGEQWRDTTHTRPTLGGAEGAASLPDRTAPVSMVTTRREASQGDLFQPRIDKHLPEIASLLDKAQFELITRPDGGLIAIKGSAGSGKTTVALHRVAYLNYLDAVRFSSKRTLVIVFNRALARYISQLLPALGVDGVAVRTFDEWVRWVRRRHYPKLPKRYSEETPAVVTRVKQHSALIPMFEEAAEERPDENAINLLDELLTDRTWLGEGFDRHAPGEFSIAQLDEAHRWCTRQVFNRVDGGGAQEDELPSLDVEDDALILRLHQLLKGPLRGSGKRPLRYAHLVVDEAQDFSPLELLVMLGTVHKDNPVTLAGDVAQKINEHADFRDWASVLSRLGHKQTTVTPLEISYRSTHEIMEVAHAILGPLAPPFPGVAPRRGASVPLFRFGSEGEVVTFLTDVLRDLTNNESNANIAVLSRTPRQAEAYYQALKRSEIHGLRRVVDQEFSFEPGIEVTDVRQTKGLEFDYVILLDCDDKTYTATSASRHLMHVGITRAAHQCWLTCVGNPSPILPDWLESSF